MRSIASSRSVAEKELLIDIVPHFHQFNLYFLMEILSIHLRSISLPPPPPR